MPQQSQKITAFGLITRSNVSAAIEANPSGGICFSLEPQGLDYRPLIKAEVSAVSSTQRNTVLEDPISGRSLCLVEHFMAASALLGLNDIKVELSADELPFGDGSALFWLQELKALAASPIASSRSLKREIYVEDPNNPQRNIRAIPSDENFKITYVLDMRHINSPIGLMQYSWQLGINPIEEIASARTFSSEAENIILGLNGIVLGYTESSFTMPLRQPLEAAQHKALDLLGDMYLSGINPLDIKMHVISNQAGHSLNVELARQLQLSC